MLPLPSPLPVRDGVSPSCTVLPPGHWSTIAEFLAERFVAISADTWLRRIEAGEVVDVNGLAVTPARRFEPHLKVFYYRKFEYEQAIPFEPEVLYRDEHLVIADKPHFLPVAPVGKYVQQTLLVRLKRQLGIDDLVPVHRIDRETAGLVMLSVQPATRNAYHTLFEKRRVEKHYEAIVPWQAGQPMPDVRRSRLAPDSHFMRMREVDGEPNSETHIAMLDQTEHWAHLRLSPVTGRQHQLRVHCAALGMPIRNDAIYPVLLPEAPADFDRPLQLLARELRFVDPLSGESRRFETRLKLAWPVPPLD
ncbi:conserved hypothetical protein [Burkholderiales bacterium 8X]|nr:conserved hypothetical protein [Burkholderiales bacterium 8X]